MTFELAQHQIDAVEKLDNGKILVGGVGSGKSIAALAYAVKKHPEKRIVAITTARKRDKGEWFSDAMKMSLRQDLEVDSWNNLKKYEHLTDVFFIFDEQKLVGNGAWVTSFYKIAKNNPWILLSATPADTWMDLVPIFIAHGFYKNRTEFNDLHVRWARFVKYPKVDGYLDVWTLGKHREAVYVEMPYDKVAVREDHIVEVDFNREHEKLLYAARWNFYENVPVKDAGEMMRLMRQSANLDISRYEKLKEIIAEKRKVIVFYNHNPELAQLRLLMTELDIPVHEWNGHVHQDVPTGDDWVYLVQYQAGGEAWNCITTDTIVFYSLPYSYKQLEQAKGRIDRLNTPYETLHYYIFKSRAIIDQGIWRSLNRKKNFQASAFGKKRWEKAEQTSTPLIDRFAA